jgi:hypothetical protein
MAGFSTMLAHLELALEPKATIDWRQAALRKLMRSNLQNREGGHKQIRRLRWVMEW